MHGVLGRRRVVVHVQPIPRLNGSEVPTMSRFGGDGDENFEGQYWLWERAQFRCFNGRAGQQILHDLRDALLALPEKKLIRTRLADETGAVCALGALAASKGFSLDELARLIPADLWDEWLEEQQTLDVALQVGVKPTMAVAIAYANDVEFRDVDESDEERYARMLRWVEARLIPELVSR